MKVVIAGGGAVGAFIAGELQEAGHEVHIIEQDEDRVTRMQAVGEPAGAKWHLADACEVSSLRTSGWPTPTSWPRSPGTTRTTW